jgi:hypothetical protein
MRSPEETEGTERTGADMPHMVDPLKTLAAHVEEMAHEGYRRRRVADLARITGETRRPARDRSVVPGHRRRPLLLVPVAAGTVAVAVAAYAVEGGTTPRTLRAPTSSTPAMRDAAVVQELDRAASVVARGRDVRPLPHQWLYVKTVFTDSGPGTRSARQPPMETWTRFDGRKTAFMENGRKPPRLVFHSIDPSKEGDDRTPAQEYADLKAMSTDPGALLAQIQHKVDTVDRPRLVGEGVRWTADDRDDWTFRHLAAILGTQVPVPPGLQAAVYRAMAKIPGVRIKRDVVDAAGRHGLAIGRESTRTRLLDQIIVDPHTYRYLGTRTVIDRTQPPVPPTPSVTPHVGGGKLPGVPPVTLPPAPPTLAGTVQSQARVDLVVTDEAGQRP